MNMSYRIVIVIGIPNLSPRTLEMQRRAVEVPPPEIECAHWVCNTGVFLEVP